MTKRHFVSLADVLRHNKPTGPHEGQSPYSQRFEQGQLAHWNRLTEALADWCQSQNSNFNRERWLGYIAGENGPSGGKI
jgi:hypothetical protein